MIPCDASSIFHLVQSVWKGDGSYHLVTCHLLQTNAQLLERRLCEQKNGQRHNKDYKNLNGVVGLILTSFEQNLLNKDRVLYVYAPSNTTRALSKADQNKILDLVVQNQP